MNLKQLEELLKLKEGTLKDAATSEEEVSIELGELKVFTSEEFDTLKGNLKVTHEQVGLEKAIKEMRNELGYNFEGKTLENLLAAHLEANKPDSVDTTDKDEAVKTLEDSLKSLQGKYEALELEKNGIIENHKKETVNRSIDESISKAIKDPSKYNIPSDYISKLFKSEYQIEQSDDFGLIVKKDGNILKDHVERPVTVESQVNSFAESFLKQTRGGAGGGDSKGSGSKITLSKFTEQQREKGIQANSPEFVGNMNKLMSDGLIDLDN